MITIIADIINSRTYNQESLHSVFMDFVDKFNLKYKDSMNGEIISGIGDEFFIAVDSISDAFKVSIGINEELLKYKLLDTKSNEKSIRSRVSIVNQEYDLTNIEFRDARKLFHEKNRKRSVIRLSESGLNLKSGKFLLIDVLISLMDSWPEKDLVFIYDILNYDISIVANKYKKSKQQIQKRIKTLNIESYMKIKELLIRESLD